MHWQHEKNVGVYTLVGADGTTYGTVTQLSRGWSMFAQWPCTRVSQWFQTLGGARRALRKRVEQQLALDAARRLGGTRYALCDYSMPPAHPNCRSTTVPT